MEKDILLKASRVDDVELLLGDKKMPDRCLNLPGAPRQRLVTDCDRCGDTRRLSPALCFSLSLCVCVCVIVLIEKCCLFIP